MKNLNLCALLTLLLGAFIFTNCTTSSENSTTANNANTSNGNAANNNSKTGNTNVNSAPKNDAATTAEKPANLAGNWDSEKLNVKGDKRTEVSLFIKQDGEKISGTYSVVDFIGDEPQVEDGNQTPFAGTIKGSVATIKFDPEATVAGYEENVRYKEPADGRKPATATLTLSGKDLQVNITSGEFSSDVPKKITFQKSKRVK